MKGANLHEIGRGKAPRGQKTSRCKKRTIQLHGLQRFRKWIHTTQAARDCKRTRPDPRQSYVPVMDARTRKQDSESKSKRQLLTQIIATRP
jgi:hypothetical protein